MRRILTANKIKNALDTSAFIFTTRLTDTFTIPTKTGEIYNYNVTTSDGHEITDITGDVTITFSSTDVHTIHITGNFPVIYFNNGGSRFLMGNIVQWGNPDWGSNFERAFYGCTFLTCTATDNPFFNVVNGFLMFRQCSSFTLTNHMNFEQVTNAREMFRQTRVVDYLDHEFSSLEIAPNMGRQVIGDSVIRFRNFNPQSLIPGSFPNGMAQAFFDNKVHTEDYSNVLIRASLNNPNNNVRFDSFRLSNYNSSAVSARADLITRGWILEDAGLE